MVGGHVATVLVVFVIAYLVSKVTFAPRTRYQVVQAEQFELVSKDGKHRAMLGMTTRGDTVLWFYDKAGKVSATLGLTAETAQTGGNPYLRFSNEDGNDSACFDRSSLSFTDKKGTLRTYLGLNEKPLTAYLYGPSADIWGLYLYGQDRFKGENAELQVRGDKGWPSLSLNADGVARATLHPTFLSLGFSKNDDKDIPEQHVGIYASTTAGPILTLNKQGKVIWEAP